MDGEFFVAPYCAACHLSTMQLVRSTLLIVFCLVALGSTSAEPLRSDPNLWSERELLLDGIDENLRFLRSPQGERAYAGIEGEFSRRNIERSLRHFRTLLLASRSRAELDRALLRDFKLYQSEGLDGRGRVHFTGYYQPAFRASREKTAEYRYPIFRRPQSFDQWPKPHPTRVELEGWDGTSGRLKGMELAYLRSRYDVYMVHVQGSAVLEMTDGSEVYVGFAGATEHRFRGIDKRFVTSRKLSSARLKAYFDSHPEEFNALLSKNNRFIFFEEKDVRAPIGSLGLPVLPGRSIATDKRALPPAALGMIVTRLGDQPAREARIVLDRDSGDAIRGRGRVDVFMGSGDEGARRANAIYGDGSLYYLLLRD